MVTLTNGKPVYRTLYEGFGVESPTAGGRKLPFSSPD